MIEIRIPVLKYIAVIGLLLLSVGLRSQILPERNNYTSVSFMIPDVIRNQLESVSAGRQDIKSMFPVVDRLSRQDPQMSLYIVNRLLLEEQVVEYDVNWAKLQYYKSWLELEQYSENEELALLQERAEEAAHFFEEEADILWQAKCYSLLSSIHYNISYNNDDSIYQKATQYNQLAQELMLADINKINFSYSILGEILRIKGNICFKKSNCPVDSVLAYYDTALEYYKLNKDRPGQADVLLNKAITFGAMERNGDTIRPIENPEDYFVKAINTAEQANDLLKIRLDYAIYLRDRFGKTKEDKWYEKSNEQALTILQSKDSKKSEAYMQLAINTQAFLSSKSAELLESEQKQLLDSVVHYYHLTLRSSRAESNLKVYNEIFKRIATVCPYFPQKKCSELLRTADTLKTYFMKIDKAINQKVTASNKAYRMEIEQRKRWSLMQKFLIFLLILIGITSFIFYRQRIKNLKNTLAIKQETLTANEKALAAKEEALAIKQEALRAQMNPHFISNAINAIESLVNQGRNDEASEYLIDFSRLCRMVIEHSKDELITLAQEISTLKYFLSLEELRLADDLEHSLSIHHELIPDAIMVPPLILQPFVENAIWHGIKNKPEPKNGKLNIAINRISEDRIEYIIEDNGVGRAKAKALQQESVIDKKSWGVSMTQDRINYLNKENNAQLDVIDLYDKNNLPRGTKVIIHLPIIQKNNNITMLKIKAIIVEDEKEGMENLVIKITKHCPNIDIVAKCRNGEEAIKLIDQHNPDLVFLDVLLGSMTGFDVLNKLSHIHFELIFTTAYDKYAIDAFKVSALDFLLKPIKPNELVAAVEKACKRLHELGAIRRISVPISNGYQYIPIDDIMYCLADDSYTKIIRHENSTVLVTKTLKYIAQRLPLDKFFRISRSAFINTNYVDSFQRSSGGLVTMKNGDELSVSKDRRTEFMNRMAR